MPTANSQQPTANSQPENRLYRADCRNAFKKLIAENIKADLICLDPPFNSSSFYNLIYKPGNSKKTAQQLAFHDMWTPTKQTQYMFDEFKDFLKVQPDIEGSVKVFLEAWLSALNEGSTSDRKLLNYLIYMAERLILMKKLLKDTGSIYYHCDPTASHYIKVVMDGIFGRKNFQNEIVWCYSNSGRAKRRFSRKHDIIFLYSCSPNFYWGDYRIPVSNEYLESHYREKDAEGKRCRIRIDHGVKRIYYPEEGVTCNDWCGIYHL